MRISAFAWIKLVRISTVRVDQAGENAWTMLVRIDMIAQVARSTYPVVFGPAAGPYHGQPDAMLTADSIDHTEVVRLEEVSPACVNGEWMLQGTMETSGGHWHLPLDEGSELGAEPYQTDPITRSPLWELLPCVCPEERIGDVWRKVVLVDSEVAVRALEVGVEFGGQRRLAQSFAGQLHRDDLAPALASATREVRLRAASVLNTVRRASQTICAEDEPSAG